MIMLAAQHKVKSYDQWKRVFDGFPPTKGGAHFYRVNRDVEDPNSIVVVAGFPTVEAARAFTSNPELAAAMGEAGVVSAPRFELYEEVEVVEA